MITASMPLSPGSVERRIARISHATTASNASNAMASWTTIVRSRRLPMGATTYRRRHAPVTPTTRVTEATTACRLVVRSARSPTSGSEPAMSLIIVRPLPRNVTRSG